MPDLNSLPPSQNASNRSSPVSQHRPTSLSRSPSSTTNPVPISTNSTNASATAVSSGSPRLPRSPHIERRHSSLLRDLNYNDGSGSGSGNSPTLLATQLPQPLPPYHSQHHRAPSLGELHQELENEQEAQVNRLLAMIRQQQAQIQQLQAQSGTQPSQSQTQADSALAVVASNPASEPSSATVAATAAAPTAAHSSSAIAASTPGSSRRSSTVPSRSQSQIQGISSQSQQTNQSSQSQQPPQQPGAAASPSNLSRESSYRRPGSRTENRSQASHGSSPSIRPHEGVLDWGVGHYGLINRDRDEVVYYQTETAMVQRENQMLKGRIRELERQIQELGLRPSQTEGSAQMES